MNLPNLVDNVVTIGLYQGAKPFLMGASYGIYGEMIGLLLIDRGRNLLYHSN